MRCGISEVRNQIWENLHPISHLVDEKCEVGSKREFSFLKPYPPDATHRREVQLHGVDIGAAGEECYGFNCIQALNRWKNRLNM